MLTLQALAPADSTAAEIRPGLQPCRLDGVEPAAWCGSVRRPLDPEQPLGRIIDVHFALLPAVARNREPDPVLFFAGGPGQSAIGVAGTVARLTSRLARRRDVILIDQRGTGRSAPLMCDEPLPTAPLIELVDPARQTARLLACRQALQQLPHGDLRQYTTSIAVQDADAVRQAVGAPQVNLVGASYGTRAALEYLRQFPQAVRRLVLDGVAPPDMVLPVAGGIDAGTALDRVLTACASEPACAARHPTLRGDWKSLLDAPPRSITVAHPATGRAERVMLDPVLLSGLVRGPLYTPALASALPWAVAEASAGRWEPLFGLSSTVGPRRAAPARLAEGLHFSVVCAEDLPRMPAPAGAVGERVQPEASLAPGGGFPARFSPAAEDSIARRYRAICTDWPRGAVPEAFYSVGPTRSPALLLSGGADPATPPRHGERTARALGPRARHVVVAGAGHGVMSIPCMPEVLFRFIDASSDEAAMQVDAGCASAIPRPGFFAPPGAGALP